MSTNEDKEKLEYLIAQWSDARARKDITAPVASMHLSA